MTLSFTSFTEDPVPVQAPPTDVRWIDPTDAAYGMDADAVDNTAALQAACDAASSLGLDVLIPPLPEPNSYKLTGTVDLVDLSGLKIGALGGGQHTSVRLANVANNSPIFKMDGEAEVIGANGFVFERIRFEGLGIRATATNTVLIDRCVFVSGGLGYGISLDNSWGWTYRLSDFHANAAVAGAKAVVMNGLTGFDVDTCYLHQFDTCRFFNGGVGYRQQVTAASGTASWLRFENCYTENFDTAVDELLEVAGDSGVSFTMGGVQFQNCLHADTTGSDRAPMIRFLDATVTVRGLTLINADNFGTCVVQVDSTLRYPNFYDTLIQGCGSGQIVTSDKVTEYNAQYGTVSMKDGGLQVVSRSEYDNFTDVRGLGTMPFGIRKAGDRHLSFGTDHDGKMHWAPTGATGSGVKFDTNLYREGVGILATDTKLHVVTELEVDGAFNHDGSTFGVFGTTPAAQPAGTTDVLASLVTLGLRAASSNPPLNLGSGTVTGGRVNVGEFATDATAMLSILNGDTHLGTATTLYGTRSKIRYPATTTGFGIVYQAQAITVASAFTMNTAEAFEATSPSLGAASAITNVIGYQANNQGAAGVTNAYGLSVAAQSGAATLNIGAVFAGGTTANLWLNSNTASRAGGITFGTARDTDLFRASAGVLQTAGLTTTGLHTTAASATGTAGLNVPHGVAPTAPVDGDMWTTTAGLFVRINGATVGPLS